MSVAIAGQAFAQADTQTTGSSNLPPPNTTATGALANTDGQAAPSPTSTATNVSEVVVTGTRINRPNLTSTVPITTIGPQDLTHGNVSLGDELLQLPQIRATFSQANSTRFIGTAGISAIDLRGLGTQRTLVLVDGRRVITSTPGIERVDINTIPVDLIQRVDIVTGGNSAVYGSDAVAGVTNFILNRSFEGVRVRAQGGISSREDRASEFVSLTAGRNFAEGRGNIALAAEIAHQDTLLFTDRPDQSGAFAGRSQFNATEFTGIILNPTVYPNPPRPAEPATGNGIPDNSFLTNIKNNNISNGGLFTATCPTTAAAGESAAAFAARRAAACSGIPNPSSSNPAAQFGRTFVFNPDGSLVPNPCVTDLRYAGSNNCVGGLGSTLRETGFFEPGLTRKSLTMLGHYSFSDAFVPFFEASYVDIHANQQGQPTFTSGNLINTTFSINNPFLTPQARAQLLQILAPGQTTFTTQRFNVDFGGRGEEHDRETYRLVGGVGGTFNDTWKYEVSVNYGHLKTFYSSEGNVLSQRINNSINAVRNAAGQIVCAINAVTVVDPACVPVNLFGSGQVSQAALNYFGWTSTRRERASLLDVTAYLSGDTAKWFQLPGGAPAFVVGAEYRRETAFSTYDPTTASGATFLNAIPAFAPPAEAVKEVFGELNLPVLKDMPFAQELSLDAAGRYSDYNIGSTGGVFAWNLEGVWAPVRDLKFRVAYARSVRAPTQSDLYATPTQTFVNNFSDPCSQSNINNNPNRAKNCAAAGVPTTQTFTVGGVTTTEPFTNNTASGISAASSGNPKLQEERGKSLTVGAIFQPHWVPGLSLTVDYYQITVENAIFSLGGQTIINQCYDSPSGINNPFCAVVFRNPNGTFLGQQSVIHAGTTVPLNPTGFSVISQPFNYAKYETSGVDVDMGYRRRFGDDITLNLRTILSYTIKRNTYTDVTNPSFRTQQLFNLGDPRWQGTFSADLKKGPVNFGWRVRYIGKQTTFDYATQHSVQGRPPTNPDVTNISWYPGVFYHDFRVDIDMTRQWRFYIGIDNAFNKLPPLDLLGTEGGDPYDPVGRFVYTGVEAKF